MSKRKLTVALLGLFICSMLLLVPIQPVTQPQETSSSTFVIASWEFPDEYGQGIEGFEFFENSTGSWAQVGGYEGFEEPQVYDWNASVAIKLRCWTWFNSTLTGVSTTNEGKLYQRHNVTVTCAGTTIFSQQNFTWFYDDDTLDPPLWFYGYEVILNFLPVSGEIYTVTVTYEVFY